MIIGSGFHLLIIATVENRHDRRGPLESRFELDALAVRWTISLTVFEGEVVIFALMGWH